MSSHQTQEYFWTTTQLSLSNCIIFPDIGGMVFFGKLIEDGDIEPDSGDKIFQEDDGELSDNASHFASETINDPEDHHIYDNIANQPRNEEPPEVIEGRGVKIHYKPASYLLKILSPIPSPKMISHAHKWNFHHVP